MTQPERLSSIPSINHTLLAAALVALTVSCSEDGLDEGDGVDGVDAGQAANETAVEGRVIDALTGELLANVGLEARDPTGDILAAATTDMSGFYEMSLASGEDGFHGDIAVAIPGYWTRRFFARSRPIASGQDITFHMQSDALIAIQSDLFNIPIDEARGLVAVTLRGSDGQFVDPDFPAEIDIDAAYDLRVYLDADGRPVPDKQSGWFAIFLNVPPGPVNASARRLEDGAVYGGASLDAIGRELTGAWIDPR